MKTIFKVISCTALALTLFAKANAAVITVNMTADNILSGGICSDSSCTSLSSNWSDFGTLTNSTNWKASDSISFSLMSGTYSFAWLVENTNNNGNGNPAALLAEVIVDGNSIFSSSQWEVFDNTSGDYIANATEYGNNGESGVIWTSANRGPINGISTDASWIYSANNFANADRSVWMRTVVDIADTAETSAAVVSAPAMFGLVSAMALFLSFRRTK